MEIFEAWPPALLIASGLLGLVVGSFLNVVAYRLPIMLKREWQAETEAATIEWSDHERPERFDLWWPPSTCPACSHPIPAHHNIPVLSYIVLRGRCGHCAEPISIRYPIVEACTGFASVIVAIVLGPTWTALAALVLTWFLIALSLIDFDTKLLPDDLTLPLLWMGLLVNVPAFSVQPLFADLSSCVIGAAAGYLSLWAVYHAFKLLTGKEGFGYGDFKLLAALGAWLGWQSIPLIIMLSAAVGSVVGLTLIVAGQSTFQSKIPFGPYLAGAGWIALLFGPRIMAGYFEMMS